MAHTTMTANDQVLVIAHAHTADRRAWECFRSTCEDHSVPAQILGQGQIFDYPSNDPRLFTESAHLTFDVLANSSAEYVVISDSFDVLVNRWDPLELINAINESRGKLLVSCEANCFPDGPWKRFYDDDLALIGPWRFANGGQYAGTKSSIQSILRLIGERLPSMTCGGANEVLHHCYLEGYPMSLDFKGRIFQSMFTSEQSHIFPREIDGQLRAVNGLFGTVPMFLHFNGRAPGMPIWYTRLTGREYPVNSLRPEYKPC